MKDQLTQSFYVNKWSNSSTAITTIPEPLKWDVYTSKTKEQVKVQFHRSFCPAGEPRTSRLLGSVAQHDGVSSDGLRLHSTSRAQRNALEAGTSLRWPGMRINWRQKSNFTFSLLEGCWQCDQIGGFWRFLVITFKKVAQMSDWLFDHFENTTLK